MSIFRICLFTFVLLNVTAVTCYARFIDIKLSTYEIVKNHNFSNTQITISGNTSINCNIIVEILGPPASYRIWKKEKKFGIWTNTKSFIIPKINSYHYVATNINDISIEQVALKAGIMLNNNIAYVERYKNKYSEEEFIYAFKSFFKAQQYKGYYSYKTDNIKIDNRSFKLTVPLPDSVMSGEYRVKIVLLNDKYQYISNEQVSFAVHKNKIYSWLDKLANQHPLMYLIIAVIVTLCVAGIINFIFKKNI